MTITLADVAEQARKHLGEDGPNDTCMSNGLERWCRELGIPTLDTDSVTQGVERARAHYHGWSYVEGTAGIKPGHFGDWSPKALGSPDDRHVCVVDVVDGDEWRGIGSGTPSGKVALQPRTGGLNVLSVLQGYLIPPLDSLPVKTAPKPAPAPPAAPHTGDTVHVVVVGDSLWALARTHGTTVRAILQANPSLPTRRSVDFHIVSANLIVVGQRIRIP